MNNIACKGVAPSQTRSHVQKKEPFGSERKKQRKKDPTQVGLSMHSFNWQSSGAINLNRKIIKANIFNGATLRYIVVGMFTRLALIPSNSFPKRVHDLFFIGIKFVIE